MSKKTTALHFYLEEEALHWRGEDGLPPASRMIVSPYDPEARYSAKRETYWSGYKVHLTETCDPDTPTLITNVETTISQAVDKLGVRRSRYRGIAKTHPQHGMTAAATNLMRVMAWLSEKPRSKTRVAPFAALAPST